MDLAEPPGRAAGGTAPLIVVGLDGSPASGRRLRDPCAVETERPPAPVFVVPPASQPARYAAGDLHAERRAAAQHNRSGTSHPRRIGLDLRWSSQRRSTTDPLRFGRLYVSPETRHSQ
jgi:hypothetical protein